MKVKSSKVAKVAKNNINFNCNNCGLNYVTNSVLWKHKQKCKLSSSSNLKIDIDELNIISYFFDIVVIHNRYSSR